MEDSKFGAKIEDFEDLPLTKIAGGEESNIRTATVSAKYNFIRNAIAKLYRRTCLTLLLYCFSENLW